MEKLYVNYEQFGAKGDGVTDDFDAIVAAHAYANEHGLPVRATDGAKYYIGGKDQHASVKTDVDFGTAEFIIDDRSVENRNSKIFTVEPDGEIFNIEIASLKKTDKKVDFPHEGKVLVWIYNDDHKIFIREGLNMNNGVSQHEAFVVDGDGNIESTLNWDYEKVTKCYGISVEDKPVTLRGGIFTTIANQEPSFYNYYSRCITVKRANTTICDVKHYVTGELDHGAPYGAFISVRDTYNVTIKDVLMTPRFIYWTPSKVPGKDVPMGSYDLGTGESVKINLIGIKQTIDITDRRYWGIIGSNYCKEFYLEDCEMSRFDAHQGATDVVIKNSTFGHQRLSLIGHGSCVIENTTVYGESFIALRGDYGCHWDGTITVKNCRLKPATLERDIHVIGAWNKGYHDFGYTAKMPSEIVIDGLEILDGGASDAFGVYVLPNYADGIDGDRPYRYVPTSSISSSGVRCESGREAKLLKNAELYPDLIVK